VRLVVARRLAALAVAAALGIGTPVYLIAVAPREHGVDELAAFDAEVGYLHKLLGPGAVVGLGLNEATTADPTSTTPEEHDRIDHAQYALAPALVRALPLRACLSQGPAACGADGVTHAVLLDVTPDVAEAFARRLGFRPVSARPGVVFLSRTAP
jgi:hypothetical protein